MIVDTLNQGPFYHALNPRFARAFEFLKSVTPAARVGRHDIDGEEIFAFVQQHLTQPTSEKKLEVHRTYIDIQYVVRGREIMAWAPLAALPNPTMPYDAAVDAALYAYPDDAVPVQLRAGHFAILFPEDAHAPSCMWDEPAEVLKVVVKVKI